MEKKMHQLLAESFVSDVKKVMENTTMYHRYNIDTWLQEGKYLLITIGMSTKTNRSFDNWDMKFIEELKEEIDEIWDWYYDGNNNKIEISIQICVE